MPDSPDIPFGLIAGKGVYPFEWVDAARRAGVAKIVVAAFEGETDPDLKKAVDRIEWMRVGQLGRMIKFLASTGARRAVMAGQITPSNLYSFRPDLRALLLLAKLKERNAETLFGAIADQLEKAGVTLAPATTFMEDQLAPAGRVAGPSAGRAILTDLAFGLRIAKETSRMDIGQTVIVRSGTVLAVEAFEGTNEALRRGGRLGKGRGTAVKVSKPGQDLRFDVPVIGPRTVEVAAAAGICAIGVEAGRTLLLEKEKLAATATSAKIVIHGLYYE